jgi:CheY-like chemotaxis protein
VQKLSDRQANTTPVASFPPPTVVLHLDDSPNDLLLFQTAAETCHACFITHPILEIPSARDYLLGIGRFIDRRAHPFPAMLLLDYSLLHGATGAEVLRWVRSQPQLNDLMIVMLSGSDRVKYVAECYRDGADYFLLKPPAGPGLTQIAQAFHQCLSLLPPCFTSLSWLPQYRSR